MRNASPSGREAARSRTALNRESIDRKIKTTTCLTYIEFYMMEHDRLIEASRNFPQAAELIVASREGLEARMECTKLPHIDPAQFFAIGAGLALARTGREGRSAARAIGDRISMRSSSAQIVGESLKFVVKYRLPTGLFPKQHYISESSRRHETCSGGIQRELELKGGRLPGIRHHSNLETRIRGLR